MRGRYLIRNQDQSKRRLPPRSHSNDPPSSKMAEAKGAGRAKQRQAVLALVLIRPDLTASDLASAELAYLYLCCTDDSGFSHDYYERRQQVRRRLSDLRLLGQVERRGGKGRECVWRVVS